MHRAALLDTISAAHYGGIDPINAADLIIPPPNANSRQCGSSPKALSAVLPQLPNGTASAA
jgi:hypothetical protein